MPDIETGLVRLEAALERVATASDGHRRRADDLTTELAETRAERDRLREEVNALRAASEEDARLRAEAADAVRSALSDLRGLMHEESQANA